MSEQTPDYHPNQNKHYQGFPAQSNLNRLFFLRHETKYVLGV